MELARIDGWLDLTLRREVEIGNGMLKELHRAEGRSGNVATNCRRPRKTDRCRKVAVSIDPELVALEGVISEANREITQRWRAAAKVPELEAKLKPCRMPVSWRRPRTTAGRARRGPASAARPGEIARLGTQLQGFEGAAEQASPASPCRMRACSSSWKRGCAMRAEIDYHSRGSQVA
jgi:hypothetical protein